MSTTRTRAHTHTRWLALAAALGFAGWALAQAVPPGFVASPEVYKVIAENEKYRVIEVTWKPGQKDARHGHSDSAVYYLRNCRIRVEADGSSAMDFSPLAGRALVQMPIAAHTVQNIGTSDCKLIMFEPK